MRDEDAIFADIVRQEFDERWEPSALAPQPPPQPPPPMPDFHLELYDDDESYRQVSPAAPRLSVATRWGVALIGVGLLIAIGRFAPLNLPVWLGWVAVGCFVAGTSVCLWHVTHRPRRDEPDDEGVV